jgi:hypothetical protein
VADNTAPAPDANGQPMKLEVPEVVSFTIKCSYAQTAPQSPASAPAATSTTAPASNQIAQK